MGKSEKGWRTQRERILCWRWVGCQARKKKSQLAFLIITAAHSNISPVEQSETADGIVYGQLGVRCRKYG